jgi:hypothetical protein
MRLILKIVLLFVFSSKACVLAKICEAEHIDAVALLLDQADKDTLVLWDVDDVLIAPENAFFMDAPIRKRLYEKFWLKHSKQKRKELFSHFFTRRTVELVNPKVLDLLADLARRQVPYTGLSAWWTGPYGTIPCMEDLRFKSLREVGISFVATSPFKEDLSLSAFKSNEGTPMVKNGLILTALADKGSILEAVLEATQLKFARIIFIEDNRSNLKAVHKLCQKLKIDFLGIHYTEAKYRPLPPLNKAHEKKRFQILEQEGLWLLDEELEARLQDERLGLKQL